MKKGIEHLLFGSRWLLVLFYSGLIVALLAYAFIYLGVIYHMIIKVGSFTPDMMMICMLELVDMVMIASLIKMIITGSYHAFINKDHEYKDEKASSGFLKLKIATSL